MTPRFRQGLGWADLLDDRLHELPLAHLDGRGGHTSGEHLVSQHHASHLLSACSALLSGGGQYGLLVRIGRLFLGVATGGELHDGRELSAPAHNARAHEVLFLLALHADHFLSGDCSTGFPEPSQG